MSTEELSEYDRFEHTDGCRAYQVYRRGSGPPVIVLHEMFGISPPLLKFASTVADRDFSVYLPALVDVPERLGILRPVAASIQICLSAEFVKLATGRASPVVRWLRSLARRIHAETGRSIGVVGMCLTGGFALAMALEPAVVAPIIAQPSLPLGIGWRRSRDLGVSKSDLKTLKDRSELRVFGARFTSDLVAPCARFDRMEEEFGERFIRREVRSGRRSPHGLSRWEHSTLTSHILGEPEHPVYDEMQLLVHDAIDFLAVKLKG